MSEPTLESISDYNNLEGEKKKVVLAVILAGIIMGIIYTVAYNAYDKDDAIQVNETIKTIPVR